MEEEEQSTGYLSNIDEKINENFIEKEETFKKNSSYSEKHCHVPCICNEKKFCGKKCECVTIKEDIRTLFSLGEFIDKLIAGQKKALQTPVEQSKPYKMLDIFFEMNMECGECFCKEDKDNNNTENELSNHKVVHHNCQCPELPRKRCVLRIIRNDVHQRMKLVKKLNFLLTEKNKKIDALVKKREINDPSPPHEPMSVSYDENIIKVIESFPVLKEMKDDVPKACLPNRKELLKHIGLDRTLPKPLRDICVLEELDEKMVVLVENIQEEDDLEKGSMLGKRVGKDECRCLEIDKKIEFIQNFKSMIGRLNPNLNREEEILDISKSETKTIEQLIKEKRKQEEQRLTNLVHKRKKAVQSFIERHMQLEEERMLIDVIEMLMGYIKQLEEELESYENNPEAKEIVAKLIEKKEIQELLDLLNKYRNRNEDPPCDEKSLLEEINEKLQDYLDKQKNYFEKMEKIIPGFKIAIFDDELDKERIVAEICRDDDKYKYESKEAENSEADGRKRLRTLLKGMKKPHLHVISNPLERIGTNKSSVGTKVKASKPSIGSSKKNVIKNLKTFKKKIGDKLSNEVHECKYEKLEKQMLKEFGNRDPPPLPKEEDRVDTPLNMDNGEMVYMKLKNMAFEEGRKIVSQPDPIIQREENAMCRKRLVHELGLKCKKGGTCCTEKSGPSKLALNAVYESKSTQDCRCEYRLKQLNRLENDFENIILQPEKHHIDFISGPQMYINTDAIKRMLDFIQKHALKKKPLPDPDLIESLSKRRLATEQNETRFSQVWKSFKGVGLFSMNLEAQMMMNERIIIRPQYKKRVKVLSGGRTGLDPLYGEYVCSGMLDGVVLGNKRNGPIPRAILQAIIELDSGEGVVIIILNENEERLSFLFAIERARKLGIDAKLVLARDDISDHQPEKWRYGRRGHTGIVLQFKVAAGMAAKGYNLAAISRVTQGIQVATLGCSLTQYGPYIGTGIRDERGNYVPGIKPEDVLSKMLRKLMDPTSHHSIVPEQDTKMIIIINKFKIPGDDVYSIISYISKRILETGAKVGRAYHGNFSTFKNQGFSITLAKDWNEELIQFLDFPTTSVHWPPHLSGNRDIVMSRTRFYREHIIGAHVPPENVDIVFEVVDRTLREIAFSVDGMLECHKSGGMALLNVIWALKPNLRRLPLDRPYLFLCLVGKVLDVNLQQEVGKYFHLILVAAAQEFMKDPDAIVSWLNWCRALTKGTQSLAGYTKFKVGDGTMLDYLIPMADAIGAIKEDWSPLPFLYEGLERVKHFEAERKYDIGIIVLHQFFKNMYSTLNEFVGHYTNKAWWKVRPSPQILLVNKSCKEKVCPDGIPEGIKEKINKKEKEWLEYSSPKSSVYSMKDDRKTEPSIDAGSLEEIEGEAISLLSAAGILFEQLQSKTELSDNIIEELSSLFDESSSWKFLV